MGMNAKQLSKYRLSHPQKETILLVGSYQVRQTDDSGVVVCSKKWNDAKGLPYWSGSFSIQDAKANKEVALRPKTFKTMEKNGILTLAGDLPESRWNSGDLIARLTALGWDMFSFLAAERIAQGDVWEAQKRLIESEEREKGIAYRVRLSQKRRVLVVKYQEIDRSYDVVANSQEEAAKLACEILTKEDSWGNDWYPKTEDYPQHAVEDDEPRRIGDADKVVDVTDILPLVVGKAVERSYGAETVEARTTARCRAELGLKPKIWVGITNYVNDGARPAWIQQQLAADFGGRLLVVDSLGDTEAETEDKDKDDDAVDADLNRFGGMFEDED